MSALVVDADILQASGTSDHPHSSNARLILEKIRSGGHILVQTPAIKSEHDKHQSRFAKTWRANMISTKKWIPKRPPEDSDLRQHLVRAQQIESPKDEIAVLKDTHLLEAAAASDLRIVSKDTTAMRLFKKGCPLPEPYGRILWGDATMFPEETAQWIEQGCPDHAGWRLCP